MVKGGVIYILTNENNTTLYTGVTSDLISRIMEHRKNKYPNSLTSKYHISKFRPPSPLSEDQ
jgi:putative endonuclease